MVVGGGLAGLAASIEASRAGAPVILMEKANRIGGNSAKATSGVLFIGKFGHHNFVTVVTAAPNPGHLSDGDHDHDLSVS